MRRWIPWAVVALIVAALALAGVRIVGQRKAQQAQDAARLAQRAEAGIELAAGDVVAVQVRALPQGVPISGTLRSANVALIKARVAGELQQMTLREGDTVRAGQVLARVEPTDAQARLRQAQQQAEAAQAQMDIARRTHENNRALVEQGFISRWSLDSSAATLAAAEANHRAALAAADVARKALEDTVLRSPIAGQVSQRLAQNGERLAVDGRVLEIVDLDRLEIEASLSAADAMQVRPGQTALLEIEGARAPVRATVARVNPSVVVGSRSVLVYLALDKVPGLRQGLYAQGRLQIGSVQASAVALGAVRTDRPEPYVQIVRAGKVHLQPVTLGVRAEVDGQTLVAVQGLPADAQVIAGTVGALREGTPVRLSGGAR